MINLYINRCSMKLLLTLVIALFVFKQDIDAKSGKQKREIYDPIQSRQGGYYYPYYPYNVGYWFGTMFRPRPRPTSQIPSFTSSRPISTNSESICQCSDRTKRETRIVGGSPTQPHQYPEMVLVLYNRRQMCGGTIINNKYILTAAHCVIGNSDVTKFEVIIGAHNLDEVETSRKSVSVRKAVYHPDFNTRDFQNDIAVLELSSPLKFDDNVQPTCVPTKSVNYSGQDGIAVGWGRTSESGSSSQILREVTVPILSNEACSADYYREYRIFDSMICAGLKEGGKDACAGDSGGPLFVNGAVGTHVQVGLTSFGSGCARPGKPGVYTRVYEHIDFLLETIVLDDCKLYSNNA